MKKLKSEWYKVLLPIIISALCGVGAFVFNIHTQTQINTTEIRKIEDRQIAISSKVDKVADEERRVDAELRQDIRSLEAAVFDLLVQSVSRSRR